MTIDECLKAEILSRYKSVRDFALSIGLSNSTIDSVLKRGVLKSSVQTIIKIFNALDLDIESIQSGELHKKQPAPLNGGELEDEDECLIREMREVWGELRPEQKILLTRLLETVRALIRA